MENEIILHEECIRKQLAAIINEIDSTRKIRLEHAWFKHVMITYSVEKRYKSCAGGDVLGVCFSFYALTLTFLSVFLMESEIRFLQSNKQLSLLNEHLTMKFLEENNFNAGPVETADDERARFKRLRHARMEAKYAAGFPEAAIPMKLVAKFNSGDLLISNRNQ